MLKILDSHKQIKQYSDWLVEQNKLAIDIQKANLNLKEDEDYDVSYEIAWEMGIPYMGAIGGAVTFHLTPTSIGTIIKATHSITGNEIDLTDYDTF